MVRDEFFGLLREAVASANPFAGASTDVGAKEKLSRGGQLLMDRGRPDVPAWHLNNDGCTLGASDHCRRHGGSVLIWSTRWCPCMDFIAHPCHI